MDLSFLVPFYIRFYTYLDLTFNSEYVFVVNDRRLKKVHRRYEKFQVYFLTLTQ